MNDFCEHCDWWFRDPSPAECPGCKIAVLEQERKKQDLIITDSVNALKQENDRLRKDLTLACDNKAAALRTLKQLNRDILSDLAIVKQERDNYIDGLRHELKESKRLRRGLIELRDNAKDSWTRDVASDWLEGGKDG